MIEINNLSFSYGKNNVLRDVRLTIPDACVFGLTGINGSGKSTLLRIMAGVYKPQSGEVRYDGAGVWNNPKIRENIFFLPDDPFYSISTTGRSLYEMYRVFYPEIDRDSFFSGFEGKFKLNLNVPIGKFSKGMKRQLFVVLALSVRPKYLLLDEAFDGLDPLARYKFRQEIFKLVEENESTVIITSHALRELESFCDKYALIDGQTVSSTGDISDKLGSYCKFQLAFLDGIPDDRFAGLPVVSLERSGRFVKIILQGDRDDIAEKLAALKPAVMEEAPLDFEELFIREVERNGYVTGGNK